MTSDGTKIFGGKFLCPMLIILNCQKLICEKLCPNPPLIHVLYFHFLLIDFHNIFLCRSSPIGNTGIMMQFM